MHKVTLITGDGIGPEVADAAKRCVDSTGVNIDWDIQSAGIDVFKKEGDPLPKRVIDSILENKVALKAPITTPVGKGFRSVNVRLRQTLDLFACVRPCKSLKGIDNSHEGVDLVIVRENTEDLYAGIEYDVGKPETDELRALVKRTLGNELGVDCAISLKPITRSGSERIVEFAFDFAKKNERSRVTSVTKANIMKFSDGLFKSVADDVAKKYPDISYDHKLIDALCMMLVQDPLEFDVLVLPNLYGDIVSDLCAGLTGGLGVAPGANIGGEHAVFEAVHGSAPDIAGKGIANPTALILSACMMLTHIGCESQSQKLRNAVESVILEGENVTGDISPGSKTTTEGMVDAIIEKL